MAQIFDRIKLQKPKSSVFDLSHEKKLSLNMGDLVPVFIQETLPGDKFKVNLEHLIRFQPLLAPIMHRVNVFTHFFFVPNRLVWNQWQDFITGGREGTETPPFPKIAMQTADAELLAYFKKGSLADYLGFPSSNIKDNQLNNIECSALPFRAYQLIYNEYYRDQNLSAPVEFSLTGGIANDADTFKLRKRAWEKDYFTSALPWAQRGEQLQVPLSGTAPVVGSASNNISIRNAITGAELSDGNLFVEGGYIKDSVGSVAEFKKVTQGLEADMSQVTSSTINELRQATSIQRFMEKMARGGARYIEAIYSHFGVKSSDARLQRPEYLGGGKTPVIISEVLQNSQSTETSPQGTMVGHGISVGNTNEFTARFEEHGFVIGIMSIIPRTSYQNGLPRYMQKFDKFDYFWPDLAHIGEQEVKKSELFYDPTYLLENPANSGTFGYQPRYAEYRFVPDTVHGDMAGNLEFWHMGRKFSELPPLNQSFIESNPTHRIFAVEDPNEHKLIVQTYTNFQAIRPLPKYGTPAGL